MYYKIENKDCKVYKELRAMREKELLIEEENKKAIAAKIPYEYESFYGYHGQQSMSRISEYIGFYFNEPDKIDKSVWIPSKDDPDIYIPNNRTKAGKEMKSFLHSLKKGSFWDVWEVLNLPEIGRFTLPYVEIINDILCIYVDNKQEPKDENVIEITQKEFYSILHSGDGDENESEAKK